MVGNADFLRKLVMAEFAENDNRERETMRMDQSIEQSDGGLTGHFLNRIIKAAEHL